MNVFGEYVTQQVPDGAIGAPGLYFSSEPGLGIYRRTPGTTSQMSFCQNGVDCFTCSSTGCSMVSPVSSSVFSGLDGKVSAPTFTFQSDTKSGLFKSGTHRISMASDGVDIMDWDSVTSQVSSGTGIQFRTDVGSASAPSLISSADTTTGFYHPSFGTLAYSSSGTNVWQVGTSGMTTTVPISSGTNGLTTGAITASGKTKIPDGSSTAPSLSFTSDTSIGFFKPVAATLGVASQGIEVFRFSDTVVQSVIPFTAGTNSVTCGSVSCAGTLPVSIASTKVLDFKSVGPVTIARSQLNTVCALPSSGVTNFALHFGTQAGTMTSSYITSAPDSVNGDTWTIVQPGWYTFRMGGMTTILQTGGAYIGSSRNVSGTTGCASWTQAQTIGLRFLNSAQDILGTITWTCLMAAGDVIRCCAGIVTTLFGISSSTWFEIIYGSGMEASL